MSYGVFSLNRQNINNKGEASGPSHSRSCKQYILTWEHVLRPRGRRILFRRQDRHQVRFIAFEMAMEYIERSTEGCREKDESIQDSVDLFVCFDSMFGTLWQRCGARVADIIDPHRGVYKLEATNDARHFLPSNLYLDLQLTSPLLPFYSTIMSGAWNVVRSSRRSRLTTLNTRNRQRKIWQSRWQVWQDWC